MTTARDVYLATCNAAIARFLEALGNGTPRRAAEPVLRDQLLKAGDKYALSQSVGLTPAERRDVLHNARTDIGRQPAKAATS